jgi:hypothetical protein
VIITSFAQQSEAPLLDLSGHLPPSAITEVGSRSQIRSDPSRNIHFTMLGILLSCAAGCNFLLRRNATYSRVQDDIAQLFLKTGKANRGDAFPNEN